VLRDLRPAGAGDGVDISHPELAAAEGPS